MSFLLACMNLACQASKLAAEAFLFQGCDLLAGDSLGPGGHDADTAGDMKSERQPRLATCSIGVSSFSAFFHFVSLPG